MSLVPPGSNVFPQSAYPASPLAQQPVPFASPVALQTAYQVEPTGLPHNTPGLNTPPVPDAAMKNDIQNLSELLKQLGATASPAKPQASSPSALNGIANPTSSIIGGGFPAMSGSTPMPSFNTFA